MVLCVVSGAAAVFGMQYLAPKPDSTAETAVSTSTPPGPDAYAHVSLIGKAAIVYDLTNSQTLYSQNANTPLPLASITKLLTIYAASETLTPNSIVTMTPDSVAQANDAADAGFREGETFTFEDLARLTLAASSNNGAQAIADAASAASSQNTTQLLASSAAAIGLTHVQANNSTGLDIDNLTSGAYGTARDIAILAGALLKKEPDIAHASTLPSISVSSQQGVIHTFPNTDVDVTHLPNLLLSKTGYTDLAGGNLVVVYDAGIGHPIAIVVLGSTEEGRFTDVKNLMAATGAHFAGIAGTTTASQ